MSPKISVIVPTLNEEKNIRSLLDSLEKQSQRDCEIIVVDGGSTDRTASIAWNYHSRVAIAEGTAEFPSRNIGAKMAEGEILIFTCADVVFPRELLAKIDRSFADQELLALTGPDVPVDSVLAQIEYGIYNLMRFVFSSFPRPNKRFSTSTNFLAVRRTAFEKTGGFVSDINGDGMLGKQLSELGKVKFSNTAMVVISPRRFFKMGFFRFNLHYLYVLENFFPFLSKTSFLRNLKTKSGSVHRHMRMEK